MTRLKDPIRVDAVIATAPSLARLAERARESEALLQNVLPLTPASLRSSLQAGPREDDEWCVLVRGSAAAAKVRQLLPDWLARLEQQRTGVRRIRIRLLSPSAR